MLLSALKDAAELAAVGVETRATALLVWQQMHLLLPSVSADSLEAGSSAVAVLRHSSWRLLLKLLLLVLLLELLLQMLLLEELDTL